VALLVLVGAMENPEFDALERLLNPRPVQRLSRDRLLQPHVEQLSSDKVQQLYTVGVLCGFHTAARPQAAGEIVQGYGCTVQTAVEADHHALKKVLTPDYLIGEST